MTDQPGETQGNRRLIDLSHTVEDGMITYRGLPAPIVCDFLSREQSRSLYAEGTEFHIGRIELVANTGTYVDSPFHRFADGADLSELPLESLAELEGIVVRANALARRAIGSDTLASALDNADPRGKAVLVHTGWSKHWRSDRYFEGHPFLTAEAATYLVEQGVMLVGIDSYNIDDTEDGRRPVHTALLGAGIPIVEHMRGLEALPETGFRFSAVPVKVKGMGTFPVRAYAVVPDRPSPHSVPSILTANASSHDTPRGHAAPCPGRGERGRGLIPRWVTRRRAPSGHAIVGQEEVALSRGPRTVPEPR